MDMIKIISYRGPDDQGLWHNHSANIGLAHARLSIIDVSQDGHQPMCNEDGTIWLSYNGEIYNFLSLREDLLSRGHVFHSKTDSEVLLHLYEEEGTEMLKRLNGIFAFALWDGRKKELFLARDAIGVKPLYYSQIPSGGFLFASELKALVTCEKISRELDFEAVHQYLTYLWAPAPHTMFKFVKKLPPAHALIVQEGRITKEWCWYQWSYNGEYLEQSESGICSILKDKLHEAVKKQLISDVPIGAFLSGGLDSSAIVAMMRRALPSQEIRCYSIGFDGTDGLEGMPADLPYARKAADYIGVNLREIIVTPKELLKYVEELVYILDEPQADPAPINAMLIAQEARKDGIKVLLSGTGGDDIFSGYRRHAALVFEKYWDYLPLFFRKVLAKGSISINEGGPSLLRRIRKMFAYADRSKSDRLVSYFKWSQDNLRQGLLSENVVENLRDIRVEQPLLETLQEIPDEGNYLNQMLYLEAKHFLADHNLNYTDKTAMRYSVEVRVPLLDIDLVEFVTRIPPGMKQKGLTGKAIFKKAMESYLPRDIIYRPKTGFGVPLRSWIKHDLRDMIGDLLSEDSLRARGLFNPGSVKKLIVDNLTGRIDGAYTIFSLLCMEQWCRVFLDSSRSVQQLCSHKRNNYETSISKS